MRKLNYYIVEGGHDQDPDPEQAGRVRLRKMGAHGEGVETSHLPFSQLSSPVSGGGPFEFNRPPPPGTIVLGFDAGDSVGYAFPIGIPHGVHEKGATIPGNDALPFLAKAKDMISQNMGIPADVENILGSNRTGIQKLTKELKEKTALFSQGTTYGLPGHGAIFSLAGIRNNPLQKIQTALDQSTDAIDASKLSGLGSPLNLGSLLGQVDSSSLPKSLQDAMGNISQLLPQDLTSVQPEWGSMIGGLADPSKALSSITDKLSGVGNTGQLLDAIKGFQGGDFLSAVGSDALNQIDVPTPFGNIKQLIDSKGNILSDASGIQDLIKQFSSLLGGILQGGKGQKLFSDSGTPLPEMLGRMKDLSKQSSMTDFLQQLSNTNLSKLRGREVGTSNGNTQASRNFIMDYGKQTFNELDNMVVPFNVKSSTGSSAQSFAVAVNNVGASSNLESGSSSTNYLVEADGWFPTVASLTSDNNTRIGYTGSNARTIVVEGDYIEAGGFRYRVAATDAVDHHLTTAGGVKLYVVLDWHIGYNVKAFGAKGDGSTEDTNAFQTSVTTANGIPIIVPSGTYRVSTITGTNANFIGAGIEKSIIELSTTSTDTILDIDNLTIENMTVSDRGRSSLDHTGSAAVYLFQCVDKFKVEHCKFLTDRAVLSQVPSATESWSIVRNCSVARVNSPIAGEEEAMNIFICNSAFVEFDGLLVENVTARSVINSTYSQTVAGSMKPAVAKVSNCRFNYIHNSGVASEVKTVFLQGYTIKINNNSFTDCFGRHIDVLGNYVSATVNGIFHPAIIEGNKIGYTTTNAAATGYDNDEAGSIYCRYADATIIGNVLDFTNLTLSSSTYNGISVRHGYKNAYIVGNTIISAKAHGIECDISDSIDTDQCVVTIIGNNVHSIRSGRLPISVTNNSATKVFSNVTIRDNTITYAIQTTGIILDIAPARASSFAYENVNIEGNWNLSFNSLDMVDFQAYPINLNARNTNVTVTVNPSGNNLAGIMTSLSDAITCVGKYSCKALTIQLDPSVNTTQTITGPTTMTVAPKTVTIDGDNGASGRIRFYTAGTQQTNLAISNLVDQYITFDSCIFNSDSGTSTTALINATGTGEIIFKTCTVQYGEFFVDTRGPDIFVKGGTIDDINLGSSGSNAIFYVSSDRLVKLMIEDTTGASNNRLYNMTTPAILLYENISVGVTTGLKNFTMVT